MQIKDWDLVILCGGLGTRLRSQVDDRPKILAKIGNKVFLDILLGQLEKEGFKNIILSIGHLKEKIKEHCQNKKTGLNIKFSEEDESLGTGGALKNSLQHVFSNPFFVMNGDVLFELNFSKILNFHLQSGSLLTIVLTRQNQQHFGKVTLTESRKIKSFQEKAETQEQGLVSAGIYVMNRAIAEYFPKKNKFSLEYDLFPALVNHNCYGFITDREFLDFSTPQNYLKAKKFLDELGIEI